jgi:hypothetical protein
VRRASPRLDDLVNRLRDGAAARAATSAAGTRDGTAAAAADQDALPRISELAAQLSDEPARLGPLDE